MGQPAMQAVMPALVSRRATLIELTKNIFTRWSNILDDLRQFKAYWGNQVQLLKTKNGYKSKEHNPNQNKAPTRTLKCVESKKKDLRVGRKILSETSNAKGFTT